jgi:hypothetical protein
MRRRFIAALALAFTFSARPQSQRGSNPFDVVIRNGHIIDGTGSPWYSRVAGFV